MEDRIYKALILNDYEKTPYAEWVKTQKKTIETRMNRLFKYRGDIVVCCGASNSVGKNAGRALCIVNIYDRHPMLKEEESAACIEWHPDRKSLLLKDWRYFSRDFIFADYYQSGPYQGIFTIRIPKDVEIITNYERLIRTGDIAVDECRSGF